MRVLYQTRPAMTIQPGIASARIVDSFGNPPFAD
jgi:hypothetical protein